MRGDIMLDIDFLSRLCGGEYYSDNHIDDKLFLSRLCGGELYTVKPLL